MIPADLLYVSDEPEKFVDRGQLFKGDLPHDGRVARILFDHVNATEFVGAPNDMRVIVTIANVDTVDGTIVLAGFNAGPPDPPPRVQNDNFRNFMHVGHLATVGFLKALFVVPGGSIKQIPIKQGTQHVVASYPLRPGSIVPIANGECAAGIWSFESLKSLRCELRVMACNVGENEDVWNTPGFAPARDKRLEDNARDLAAGKPGVTKADFRAGIFNVQGLETWDDPNNEIMPGDTGIPLGDGKSRLFSRAPGFPQFDGSPYKGEYGIVQHFWCKIANGVLTQDARGCANATASYLVNDELLESAQFLHGTEFKVGDLVADAKGVVRLTTMAEINSELPVRLRIRAADPHGIKTANITRSGAVIAQRWPLPVAPIAATTAVAAAAAGTSL